MTNTTNNNRYSVVRKQVVSNPITIEIAKKHLNLENDFIEDDDLISTMVNSAERFCSGLIGSDIAYTEITHTFNKYSGGIVRIEENPLVKIESITYTDTEGVEHEVDSADYDIYEAQYFFDLEVDSDKYPGDEGTKLKLVYHTGFEENTPSDMIHAIKIMTATLYDKERDGYSDYKMKPNRAVINLLAQYMRYL